jgi:3-phosphoshikimate 1-carboxyvinyltransferase
MSNMHLAPITKTLNAKLNLPGSKSIANRVLLLAAMARGVSIIHNVPEVSEDVELMLKALSELGIKITKLATQANCCSSYKIEGCDGTLPNRAANIFCGNSGTTIRFLTAMLAVQNGSYCLTGIERMKERPIHDLLAALRQIGANINCQEKEGYPPLLTDKFVDNNVARIKLSGQISSQYLTGLLMALPQLHREITVHIYDELTSKPYVEITLALLHKFGCQISQKGNEYIVPQTHLLTGTEYIIEPDASSASYFLAMGALAGEVIVNHLSRASLQGDKEFATALELMGANVSYGLEHICVRSGKLTAIDIDMQEMPDVAMTLAVIALFAEGTTIIRGIHSWRVKETDRLQAMYNELTKLGAKVVITTDTIMITPPKVINSNVVIDTYNDHRMAMCFSLLPVAGVPIIINDYQCVGKTFANYFELFKQVCY